MNPRDPSLSISADAERVAQAAIAEDGGCDATSDALGAGADASGHVVMQQKGVAAGLAYADAVCRLLGCDTAWNAEAGDQLDAGTRIGTLQGPLGSVLRAERPVLNLLQRASGIATTTRAYVDALDGTPCVVLHTRKTAPGLRVFDVAAVVAGGGCEHRLGLDQDVMFKDNHWAALRVTGRSLRAVLEDAVNHGIEVLHVEVENAEQVREAIAAGATRLLIDNQPVPSFGTLAAKASELSPDVEIEATGGLTLETVRSYADAGAQFVSVGALTHSVAATDISLEIDPSI